MWASVRRGRGVVNAVAILSVPALAYWLVLAIDVIGGTLVGPTSESRGWAGIILLELAIVPITTFAAVVIGVVAIVKESTDEAGRLVIGKILFAALGTIAMMWVMFG